MKRILLILILCLMVRGECKAYSGEYYGVTYGKSDIRKADSIYKQLKKGKKSITVKSTKLSKVESIEAAYICKYFKHIGYDVVTIDYESSRGGKNLYECKFVGGKKFRKGIKQQKIYNKNIKKMKKELNSYEDNILKQVGNYENQLDWFLALEKHIIKTTYYQDDENKLPEEIEFVRHNTQGTAYTFVKDDNGVCSDYAELIYELCKKKQIEVYVLSGNNHAWNRVKLDGVYYDVDVTWDVNLNDIVYGPGCDRSFFDSSHVILDIEK